MRVAVTKSAGIKRKASLGSSEGMSGEQTKVAATDNSPSKAISASGYFETKSHRR